MGKDPTPVIVTLFGAILAVALYLGSWSRDAVVLIGPDHPAEYAAHVLAWAFALLVAALAVLQLLYWIVVDRIDAQIARECRERHRRFEPVDRP